MAQNQTSDLELTVRDRTRVIFNGPIKSLSSVNETGPFDILQSHANFISIIKDKLTIRVEGKKEEEMKIDQGVLKVKGNKVTVYLGIKA